MIDPEVLEKRRALLRDAYNFSSYIPKDLRSTLEQGLDQDMRDAVLQLQILAIQYGRQLQKQESSNNIKMEPQSTPQQTIVTSENPPQVTLPARLMVVPGHALPKKV